MKVPKIIEIELGEPWKLQENGASVAIPLLENEKMQTERRYRLITEVGDQVRLVDTGRIDRLQVVNGYPQAVFIRKGSIVKGDTQTRALTMSIAVAPMSKTQAEIKCVYASKGIRGGAGFSFSGRITPETVTESLRATQGTTWNKVHEYTSSFKFNNLVNSNTMATTILNEINKKQGTDDLEGYLQAEESIIDEAMKNIPADHVRQVGIAVVDFEGIAGLELFNHSDSWRAQSQSVTRNYAEILSRMASDIFEINMQKVKHLVEGFIIQLQGMDGVRAYGEGGYETYEISGEHFIGEFTTISGNLIHVLVTRREKAKTEPPQSPMPRVAVYGGRWGGRGSDPRLDKDQAIHSYSSQVNPINEEQTRQDNASGIVDYLTKKRGYETILALKENPQTFNELQKRTSMSTTTITKAVREAESLGLVHRSYRPDKSSTVYELTETGKTLKPEKFKATLED